MGKLLVGGLRLTLRVFFYLLYHPFSWTYDGVAALVSLGRWNEWVGCAFPHLYGERILEIGHGPGHLQLTLQAAGKFAVGLDASFQMSRQAQRRLRGALAKGEPIENAGELGKVGRCLFSSVYFSCRNLPDRYITP
jgi:hypothetical protein